MGHTYVKNQDWISPDQLPVRASQEKDILAQSDEGIANLLGDPTVAQAFMDAFTEYCSGQQDQTTQAHI